MGYSQTEGFIPGKNKFGNPVPQYTDDLKQCGKCGRMLITGNQCVSYHSPFGTKKASCNCCEGCSPYTRRSSK